MSRHSLFVCLTPLHILIARQIIKFKNIDDYTLIFYVEKRTKKNDYYYSLLQGHARKSFYLVKKNPVIDLINIARTVLQVPRDIRNEHDFYAGNIKTLYSRLYLLLLQTKNIFTFDDGIGHINSATGYFALENEHPVANLLFSILDKSYLYKNVKKSIIEHYTIYKFSNVMPLTVYIPLFKETNRPGGNERLTVLLTSALAAENFLSPSEELDFYRTILKIYKVDLVIPHPRNDGYDLGSEVKVSQSLKIAEEQLLELHEKYSLFVIGTANTTVLINLPPEIEKINIVTKAKKDLFFLKEWLATLGIKTIEI